MEIGAVILENTKTGRKYRDDLANFDTCRSDLVLPRDEMIKAHQLLNPDDYAHQQTAPVNNYTERHAANREQLYKVAIGVLADYPDECRGARKEISPEKWAKAILDTGARQRLPAASHTELRNNHGSSSCGG